MSSGNDFGAPSCGLAFSLPLSFSGLWRAGHSALGLTSPLLSRAASTSSAISPAPISSSFARMKSQHPSLSVGVIEPPERVPMVEHRCSNPLWRFPEIEWW